MANFKDTCFLVSTVVVVIAAGLLALLIGLVLPNEYLVEHHDDDCEEYPLRDIPTIERSLDIVHTNPYIKERNGERHYGSISDFSWLVSVSIPSYNDDAFAKYVCTGVIISINEVLTGNDCIRDPYKEEDFNITTVRSGSEHFWYGGSVHQVVAFRAAPLPPPYNALYVLNVTPEFPKEAILELYDPKLEWKIATEAGWGGNKIPYLDIMKHDPFHYETWHKLKEGCCENLRECDSSKESSGEFCSVSAVVTENIPNASRINGRPLVVHDLKKKLLLGLQINQERGTKPTFLDLRHRGFMDWAKHNNNKGSSKPSPRFNIFRNVSVSSFRREKKNDANLYGS